MIHTRDTITLALTKLRTRKIRLTITVIISSLLFSGLVAASLTARGVFKSVDSFTTEGFGNRYVAQGSAFVSYSVFQDPNVVARALAIQKDTIAAKKAAAKKLNIDYDPTTEQPAVSEFTNPDGSKQVSLNPANPAALQALKEYTDAHPLGTPQDFKNIAAPYHPIGFYQKTMFQPGQGATVQVLKSGQETYGQQQQAKGFNGPPSGLDTFVGTWSAMSDALLKPFTLPGENLSAGKDGSIPIVIPYSAAEQLLSLNTLPSSANANEQLARTKYVRSSIKDTTFAVCYRNTASEELINNALATQQQIEAHKTDKTYQKPSLIYGLPTTACGASPIIRDVRTAAEKKQAANQLTFDEQFGATPPAQQTLLFRVVGVVPDPSYTSTTISQIINSIVQSSIGPGWYMPASQLDHNAVLASLFSSDGTFSFQMPTQYAEFSNPADEKNFMDKAGCNSDPVTCVQKGKQPFILGPFGSNSLATSSLRKKFDQFFNLGAVAIALVAAVILMGTVGRMIADSRRETAVFRAIGAKRFDMARVYLLYTIFLSLIICVCALVVGVVASGVVQHKFSPIITVQALLAYNAQDLNRTFSLMHFSWPDLVKILGSIVLAGILSAIIPLFRNLRRNPIRDMRDDT